MRILYLIFILMILSGCALFQTPLQNAQSWLSVNFDLDYTIEELENLDSLELSQIYAPYKEIKYLNIAPIAALPNLKEVSIDGFIAGVENENVIFQSLNKLEIKQSSVFEYENNVRLFISSLPNLNELKINSCWSFDLEFVNNPENIKILSLMDSNIDSKHLVINFNNLSEFHSDLNFSDIEFLGQLSDLKKLTIKIWKDSQTQIIEYLPLLDELSIDCVDINNLAFLQKQDNIQHIALKDCKNIPNDLFNQNKKLESITLENIAIDSLGITAAHTNLKKLHLIFTKITDLSFINKLSTLESLFVAPDIEYIKQAYNGVHYSIDSAWFIKNPNIKEIRIGHPLLDEIAFKLINTDLLSKLPELKILEACMINEQQFPQLPDTMEYLSLIYINSDATIDVSALKHLDKLSFFKLTAGNWNNYQFLLELKSLTELELNIGEIKNEHLQYIPDTIEKLKLYCWKNITSLSFLPHFTSLKELDLSFAPISEDEILALETMYSDAEVRIHKRGDD